MSFDETTFTSIYEDLIFNHNEENGTAKTADDLIQLGWLLGQSSIALNHSNDATCAIHEENLQNYQKFILDKQSKAPSSNAGFCQNFILNANDFEKYLQMPCRGEFLDCDSENISRDDIDALLLKTDTQTSRNKKRSFSDALPANQPVKKFVFRQANVCSNKFAPQTLPSSQSLAGLDGRGDNDEIASSSMTETGKKLFYKVPTFIEHPNSVRDSGRTTGQHFVQAQPVEQQLHERTTLPSLSSSIPPSFAFDRTEKTNESETLRNKSTFFTAREELLRRQPPQTTGQHFVPAQPTVQQLHERTFLPSSNNIPPPFTLDRTKKSNESETLCNNSPFITAREELLRRQPPQTTDQHFVPAHAQPTAQQLQERTFLPSSNRIPPPFTLDRNKKSNESETLRNNSPFITAREELLRRQLPQTTPLFAYGKSTKTLGPRRSVHSKFIPPINVMEKPNENSAGDGDIDPRLKNIEPKMIELIQNEIMHQSSSVDWNDIAGLEYAKQTIQEAVIYPLLRPDIFTGLRGPPRGILLFGPPGTGKTLIGRCIASKSRSTFFSISASSLTSKWIGEGEKMVRALFAVAAVNQPAVIFIDEIDSLLSQRSDTEHESSRRLKTEFLVQLDGARTTEDERILIVGATNRPQELDEAARRRLTKRLYIPLPELGARIQILTLLLKKEPNQISEQEITEIGRLTDGFSGADMKTLCHEAMMGPIRSIRLEEMESIDVNDVPRVSFVDFTNALKRVRASVSTDDLVQYEKWDSTYGLGAAQK